MFRSVARNFQLMSGIESWYFFVQYFMTSLQVLCTEKYKRYINIFLFIITITSYIWLKLKAFK